MQQTFLESQSEQLVFFLKLEALKETGANIQCLQVYSETVYIKKCVFKIKTDKHVLVENMSPLNPAIGKKQIETRVVLK